MVKIITQETYNDTIKENMEVFAMSLQEAREETITQLEAQGVNLANIIKDLEVNDETGIPILTQAINNLKSNTDVIESLKIVKSQSDKSIPHRILAAKEGAVDIIVEILSKSEDHDTLLHCLLAQTALTDKHPDIFQMKWLPIVRKLLKNPATDIVCNTLIWFQKACILHENNRQGIMSEEFVYDLKPLILHEERDIIKETCTVLRYLTLDDDIRVEFGKAHDHARTISTEMLEDITKLIAKFKTDEELLMTLFVTIAALSVRNEFCLVVEKADGLKYTIESMTTYHDSMKLNREALKLLKALAGNDTVKVNMIQQGAAPLIESALDRFKGNETFAVTALGCISTVTLRVKENAQALIDVGIADTILEAMKIHEKSTMVLRNGAWAIRNIVSRLKDQTNVFVSIGAEEILNTAMKNHPNIAQDIKSALRDLGCEVKLIEEWTGASKTKIVNN